MKNLLNLSFNVTHKDIEDMVKLDELTFFPEDSANVEELEIWYKRNKDIFVLLKNDDKLIGYSIFFPITEECYKKYRSGEILEGEINSSEILEWQDNTFPYVLFNNISISPEFQNGDAIKILTSGIISKVMELKKRNIVLCNTIAECDSNDGIKYLSNIFNFKPVGSQNSRGDLYESNNLLN